jgi:hypothetical protein
MSQQNVGAVKRIYELGAESWRRRRAGEHDPVEPIMDLWDPGGQLDETLTAYGPPVREAIEHSSRRE